MAVDGDLLPVMTPDEAAALTVSLDDVRADGGAALRELISSQGVAIVTGVADAAELEGLEGAWKSDLMKCVDKDATASAPPAVRGLAEKVAKAGPREWPASNSLGAIPLFALNHGLPQGEFAWGARRLKSVRDVFQTLYEESDGKVEEPHVVSTDVVFFTPPSAEPPRGPPRLWPHADINSHDYRCGSHHVVQGVVYVWPSDGSDGTVNPSTTVVWPGSQGEPFERLMKDPAMPALANFCEIKAMSNNDAKAALMEEFIANARRVPVPAGALLLWTSRTIHQGYHGGARLAVPVCYEPVARRFAHARRSKLRLAALGLPSTHWASLGIQHDVTTGRSDPHAAVEAKAGDSPHETRLPLRPYITPEPLADAAALPELMRTLRHETKPGKELEGVLEDAVKEEFKEYL